jgi:chromosome segregation ATPase
MAEKAGQLEKQLGEADEKYENLRVRVRKDIRKIRENERDLEARLELLRKDSETLLQARDQRVLEMQRKIDALEFDLDQVQDSRVQAQMEAERYLARLSRVSRALQIATGLIEGEQSSDEELDDLEPLVGGAATAEEPPSAPEEPPLGASPPEAGQPEGVVEELAPLSEEIAALADAGEPTQMISSEALEEMGGGGEPESSSG